MYRSVVSGVCISNLELYLTVIFEDVSHHNSTYRQIIRDISIPMTVAVSDLVKESLDGYAVN
jgi:hypothetical protein